MTPIDYLDSLIEGQKVSSLAVQLTELQFLKALMVAAQKQPMPPVLWEEAQRVCDLPAVDEAIRNLIEDNTGDNATFLVLEIMNSAQPGEPA